MVSILSSISGRNFPALLSFGSPSEALSRKTGCPSRQTSRIATPEWYKSCQVRRLVLFDIDGTLISDGGASRDAFAAAMLEIYDFCGDLRRYDFSGRTDPQIAHMVLRDAGWSEHNIDARIATLWDRYVDGLKPHEQSRVRELPGVRALLDVRRSEARETRGRLTANIGLGARLKLRGPALNDY